MHKDMGVLIKVGIVPDKLTVMPVNICCYACCRHNGWASV